MIHVGYYDMYDFSDKLIAKSAQLWYTMTVDVFNRMFKSWRKLHGN